MPWPPRPEESQRTMYRIRFHGRGGQGMKTASRIVGSAFFSQGFEVQDAPRYGAERRGAPIFATVRAARVPIHERGPIRVPDLVVVADDSLVGVAAAGVLGGLRPDTILLLDSTEGAAVWRDRLDHPGLIFTLPRHEDPDALRFVGGACAAAAAQLVGGIPWAALEEAAREELAPFGEEVVRENLVLAREAWERFAPYAGCVHEGDEIERSGDPSAGPDWVDVPYDPVDIAAPDIHGGATSVEVQTGLWRTMRPVIDADHCNRCSWVCTTFCPDGAISAEPDQVPEIDYDHCKGCLVCVAVCPPHAIRAVSEREPA